MYAHIHTDTYIRMCDVYIQFSPSMYGTMVGSYTYILTYTKTHTHQSMMYGIYIHTVLTVDVWHNGGLIHIHTYMYGIYIHTVLTVDVWHKYIH